MEKLYTIPEVAEYFSVTRKTIYNWEADGRIKITRINGLPRITESELKRIIAEGK